MRRLVLLSVAVAVVTLFSCRGKKHDLAFYQHQIDSIRKAEQLKLVEQEAGLYRNPVEAWFDTLHIHSLPVQTTGGDAEDIGYFSIVPAQINENFGFPPDATLKAVAMPDCHGFRVILVSEMQDSVTPRLFLYTMNARLQPVDVLNLYERKAEDRQADFGTSYCEYFITSRYEIAVMRIFRSSVNDQNPVIEETRSYTIGSDGYFVENPIELQ